jgi:hypothetical protein
MTSRDPIRARTSTTSVAALGSAIGGKDDAGVCCAQFAGALDATSPESLPNTLREAESVNRPPGSAIYWLGVGADLRIFRNWQRNQAKAYRRCDH